MSDDPKGPDDVLAGLPRTRPQHASARRDAARAKAAKASAKRASGSAAKPKPKAAKNGSASRPRPKAVKTPPPEATPAPKPVGRTDPSPAELAAAAVRATGELVELGGKVLKGVLGRLPRP